jgi:hypothetical protein
VAGVGHFPGRAKTGFLAILLLAVAVYGGSVQAQTLTLSIAEARISARQALLAGDADYAAALSRALLKRDPEDFTALIILASAELALGRTKPAAKLARKAYGLTDIRQARFDAAMILSRAFTAQGKFARAQLWLRRSGQTAPNAALRDMAAQDFRRIEEIKPVSLRTRFAISPSSNVNNGSDAEVIIINGLPFVLSGDAQALSGIEATLGLTARRRMALGEARSGFVGVNLLSRQYRLSAASLAVSGGKTGADYAFGAAELDFGLASNRGGVGKSGLLTLGRNWYGGAALTNYMRLQAGRDVALAAGAPLRVGLALERQLRLDSSLRSATLGALSLARDFRLGAGQANLRYDLRNVFSASAEIAHVSQSASFSYRFARPVFGMELTLRTGISGKLYKAAFLSPALRRDIGLSASVSFLLPKFEVMGFAPVIDINLMRNFSNVDLYDSSRQSISLGIKSTF